MLSIHFMNVNTININQILRVSGFQCNPNSFFRLDGKWKLLKFQWNLSLLGDFEAEVQQQVIKNRLKLHQRKP